MSRGCMTVICRLQTRPDDFGSSQRQRTQSTCRSIHVAKVSSLTFSHVLSALSSLITRKVRLGATCHVHGVCSSSSVQFIFAWVRLTLTLLCYDLLHGRPAEAYMWRRYLVSHSLTSFQHCRHLSPERSGLGRLVTCTEYVRPLRCNLYLLGYV